MGAEGVYMGTAFMATKECPITERHKQFLVDTAPNDPKLMRKVLTPPDPAQLRKVMKQRGKIPDDEWRIKLEMVLSKEDPEQEQSFDSEEVLRAAPGSLAVSAIDKIVNVKDLINGIIKGAEEILNGDVFSSART